MNIQVRSRGAKWLAQGYTGTKRIEFPKDV